MRVFSYSRVRAVAGSSPAGWLARKCRKSTGTRRVYRYRARPYWPSYRCLRYPADTSTASTPGRYRLSFRMFVWFVCAVCGRVALRTNKRARRPPAEPRNSATRPTVHPSPDYKYTVQQHEHARDNIQDHTSTPVECHNIIQYVMLSVIMSIQNVMYMKEWVGGKLIRGS